MFEKLKTEDYEFLSEDIRFNLLYPLIHTEHSAFKSANGDTICVICNNITVLWTKDETCDKSGFMVELLFLMRRFKVTKLFSAVKCFSSLTLKRTLIPYCCTKAVKPKMSGAMISAKERHTELVARLIEKFDYEIFDDISKNKDYIHIAYGLIRQNCVYLWQDREITSMCIVLSRNKNYARLNYIYTIEDKRNKGYAKMLVYELASDLLKENCAPVLYADKRNPWSNAVYSKIGFRTLGEIYEYDVKT